jgi:hypothetical protein
MKASLACVAMLVTVATSLSATAAPVVFSGSSGSRAALVNFSVSGSQLEVTLSNISASDVLVPTDVLTGVFFNVLGDPSLMRVSAITGGPTYMGTTSVSGAGAPVGGEWSYLNGLAQYGANSGISSSGLGIFGPGNVFPPGIDLAGSPSPGGVEYGLASLGDNQATGNGGILGNELTRYAVTFLLSGIDPSFNPLTGITNVTFQYGTNLSEPHFAGEPEGGAQPSAIPEPATMGLVGVSLLALGVTRRRKQ